MNDTDVKDLFAAAVSRPDVDRIDTDAILRGGRRRARVRAAATGGSVLAVLALAGSLVVAGTEEPPVIGGPSPSAPAISAPTVSSPEAPVCKEAVLTPGGSIADQEAVDTVADRVRAEADAQPTDSLSGIVVHPDARSVDVLWVGPVPASLTKLAAEEATQGVTVKFIPARYTRTQMLAAADKAVRVPPPADDVASQGLTVGNAYGCNDGSGVKVEIAQDSDSQPPPSVPPAYTAAIQAAVGAIPVLVVPGWRPIPTVPSPSTGTSETVTGDVGQVVKVDDTGKALRLSADGFCEESLPGADVPLGPCRTVGDPNDPKSEGVSRGAWGDVQVLTGLAPSGTVSVEASLKDGTVVVGTLVRVKGEPWVAFYVVLPWTPGAVVDASHPPTTDVGTITFTTATSRRTVPLG